MPLYQVTADNFRPLSRASFADLKIRERGDLQRLLRGQIEVIADDLYVLAEEFGDWEDSRRRIDLLALDREANLVVIELKRTNDGGHMELQAIRYASMVSAMNHVRHQPMSTPTEQPRPTLIGHTPIHEAHGKLVFNEVFQEPSGVITDWLLFGSRNVPVIIFPLTTRGEVIALRHFRYGANDVTIELPGGAIESGDTSTDTVVRELAEESGYDVTPQHVFPLTAEGIWFDPASVRTQFFPFIATDCKLGAARAAGDAEEHIAVETYDIEAWFRLLAEGRVRDSKTYCVSVLALPHLTANQRAAALNGLILK